MAKNRQRAKQRQAQRRAQRLREQGAGQDAGRPPDGAQRPDAEERAARDRASSVEPGAGVAAGGFEADRGGTVPPEVGVETAADLAASAPPNDAGRSDTVVDTPPPPLAADPDADPEAAAARATVGEVGAERERARERGKVVAFLIAVWAELQRVQWPNRKQVTTLTGVVLGFVIIMGAYLGALDAIFSRLVQAII
jgi:preprotein translocase subunit SecE